MERRGGVREEMRKQQEERGGREMKGKGRETRELMTKVRITAVLKRLCGSLHEWTRNMSEHSPSSVRYTHVVTHVLHSSSALYSH